MKSSSESVSELQFQRMVYPRAFICFYHYFSYEVVSVESFDGMVFVFLESVRLIAQIFHHKTEMLPHVSDVRMRLERVLASVREVRRARKSVRYRSRYHVDGSSRSERAVLNLTTPFHHFDGFHAVSIRKVISSRGGIRGRSCQDAVFHNRNPFASLGFRPPQADIWA